MAKTVKTSNGAKLSTGYKVTLWVIGVVLFLAFAFATFCACGGLSLINGNDSSYQIQVDENGEYFIYDENGEKVYLSDLVTSSGTDVVSDSSVADDAAAE